MDSPDLPQLQSPTLYSDEKESPDDFQENIDQIDGKCNCFVENSTELVI